MFDRWKRDHHAILTGAIPLPDAIYIDKTCIRNHGLDGKTLRYRSNQTCCICSRATNSASLHKEDRNSKMIDIDHKKADLEDAKLNDEIYGLGEE